MPVEIHFSVQYPHNINPVTGHLEKNDVGAGPDFFVPRPHLSNVNGMGEIADLFFHGRPQVNRVFAGTFLKP
jgi:hypothetical protein